MRHIDEATSFQTCDYPNHVGPKCFFIRNTRFDSHALLADFDCRQTIQLIRLFEKKPWETVFTSRKVLTPMCLMWELNDSKKVCTWGGRTLTSHSTQLVYPPETCSGLSPRTCCRLCSRASEKGNATFKRDLRFLFFHQYDMLPKQ